jgi:hypothetical protein
MRRLLLLPAAALTLLGTPVLALQQPAPPAITAPTVTEVPLPAAQDKTVNPGFSQQVKADANLVGVTWDGDPAAKFTIEVKDAATGQWERAGQVEVADQQPDDGSKDASRAVAKGGLASEPIWVDDASAVRVRVDDGTAADVAVAAVESETPTPAAPPGSAGAATGWLPRIDGPDRYAYAGALLGCALLLGAFALGWSPWRRRRSRIAMLSVVTALSLAACVPSVPSSGSGSKPTGAPAQPGITMRGTWGAIPPACTNPNTDPLVFAVVHHTVNSNNYAAADSAGMVRGIQAYHQKTLGYCDIAYNFIIDRYGKIFEGRFGGVTKAVLGAHTGGFNKNSTGVALLGDYRSATIPSAQWSSLVKLLAWKLTLHGSNVGVPFTAFSAGGGSRFPAGKVASFPNRIVGHTDLWPTECPGPNVMSRMAELRRAVLAAIPRPAPVSTTAPTTTKPKVLTTTATPAATKRVPTSTTSTTTTTTTTAPPGVLPKLPKLPPLPKLPVG